MAQKLASAFSQENPHCSVSPKIMEGVYHEELRHITDAMEDTA